MSADYVFVGEDGMMADPGTSSSSAFDPGTFGLDFLVGANYQQVIDGYYIKATTNIPNDDYDDTQAISTFNPVGINNLDAILEGKKYAINASTDTYVVTFSFPDSDSWFASDPYTPGGKLVGDNILAYGEPYEGMEAFSYADKTLLKGLMFWLEKITGLEFVEVDDGGHTAGTLRAAWTDFNYVDAAGWAGMPGNYVQAGDMWFSGPNLQREDNGWFQSTVIHELGHALGLKHAFDAASGFPTLQDSSVDGRDYTIMSEHVSARNPDVTWASMGPQSFMSLDILALQQMYGVNYNATSANEDYVFDLSQQYYLTIYDSAGNDTIRVENSSSGAAKGVKIDLTPGSWSNVGTTITEYSTTTGYGYQTDTVFIMEGVVIENAYGNAGNDTLVGNGADNILAGASGNDFLEGGNGRDTISGGEGADTMDGGADQDLLDYTASSAGVMADLSRGRGRGGDAEGDRFSGFEDVAGTAYNDTLIGDAGDNRLMGGDGFDFFDGGVGADYLHGGGDQDRVNYGASSEAVHVSLDTGLGYTGDAEGDILIRIEELVGSDFGDTLEGSTGRNKFWGGEGNDLITANDGPDVLYGEGGDDTLVGGEGRDIFIGGSGNDHITGGLGNDVIETGSGSDVVVFGANHGDDTVTDFTHAEDVLDFSSFGITYNELDISQQGANVVIAYGGTTVILVGTDISNIGASDFVF